MSSGDSNKRGAGRRGRKALPKEEDIGNATLAGKEKRGVPLAEQRSVGSLLAEPQFRSMQIQEQSALSVKPAPTPAPKPIVPNPDVWKNPPSVDGLTRQGWNSGSWQESCREVQVFPMYFPRDNMYRFEASSMAEVQERLTTFFFKAGIQAQLMRQPLGAHLETCDGDEMYLTFFQESPPASSSGRRRGGRSSSQSSSNGPSETATIYMDIQRKKGDHLRLCQCMQKIVEAAKGEFEDADMMDTGDDEVMADVDALKSIESLIKRAAEENGNKAADSTQMSTSQEEHTKSFIQQADSWFTTPQLGLRKKALECMLLMTDVHQSSASTAIDGALTVLEGTVQAGPTQHTQNVQNCILTLLLNRELPNDRNLLPESSPKSSKDNDGTEPRPHFSDPSFVPTSDLPVYYVAFMNDLFHMSLQVLVQSLEVIAYYQGQLVSRNVQQTAQNLLDAAVRVAPDKDLYETLLGCVMNSESKLANGYLACKALRLLAMASPTLKKKLKADNRGYPSVVRAFQVGYMNHRPLHLESERLWQTVASS